MILEGNERGFGAELARHLLNSRDNDHVTVHSIEGFVADDLFGAFAEADAISGATQCQKHLFSLSLNPPSDADVSVEAFEAAIDAAEQKLGLAGQPRAIVFHEKNGRLHAHCVWSRIDGASMRAINIPHYKRKLGDISRALYLEHKWEMPEGFKDTSKRNPLNVSRQEAGQAKRLKLVAKALKAMFRQCWERSDSRDAFAAALREQGYLLARGEWRGFVAVDAQGKIWSLSRWCGVKPKELRERLGSENHLPEIADVLAQCEGLATPPKLRDDAVFEARRYKLVARQREERAALLKHQEARRIELSRVRKAEMPGRLTTAFLRVTGQYQKLMAAFEAAAQDALKHQEKERQNLIQQQLAERRALTLGLRREGLAKDFSKSAAADGRQSLVLPPDNLDLSREQLVRSPALILEHISKTEARFD